MMTMIAEVYWQAGDEENEDEEDAFNDGKKIGKKKLAKMEAKEVCVKSCWNLFDLTFKRKNELNVRLSKRFLEVDHGSSFL